MAGLIIEISDRSRSASTIHRFDSFPVLVGRGYQNNLILSDPAVSPEHLRITEDETGFVVEDLDSDNGVYACGRRMADKIVHIASGEKMTLGETSLRLLSPSHPVPAAVKLGYWSRGMEPASFRLVTWASLGLTLGLALLDEYFETYAKTRFSALIKEIIAPLIMVFTWAGLWSLIGYSVRRQARFHAQLLIANFVIVAIILLNCVFDYIAFGINSTAVERVGGYLWIGSLLFLMMFFSLHYATAIRTTRRVGISASIAGVAILIAVIHHYADKPEFAATPRLTTILKPPYAKLVPSMTINEFAEKSVSVFVKSKEVLPPHPPQSH